MTKKQKKYAIGGAFAGVALFALVFFARKKAAIPVLNPVAVKWLD